MWFRWLISAWQRQIFPSSDYGKIRNPTAKSDFLKILCQEKGLSCETVSVKYEQPEVNATVVDGAAMVQVNAPDTAMTFGKYSKVEIGDKVSSFSSLCATTWHSVWCLSEGVSQKGNARKTW